MTDAQRPDETLDTEEVQGLREAAAHERAHGSAELAALMERFAEHGLPRISDCTPWEEVRDAHYRSFGVDVAGPRVA